MHKWILPLLLLMPLAACHPQRETEDEHYQQWIDGGGWSPDYHDENRTR